MIGIIRDIRTKFPETHTWCDLCAGRDLKWDIEHGTVGATTNPVIMGSVLRQELPTRGSRTYKLFAKPEVAEDEMTWELIREMRIRRASMLQLLLEENNGRYGCLPIQTNTKDYRNTGRMTAQAMEFSKLVPSIQAKMSVSPAGVKAFEEATYQGININTTVSLLVTQAMGVTETVEWGPEGRRREGLEIEHTTPMRTIMIGYIDDWPEKVVKRGNTTIGPECLERAEVAVFKHAYKTFEERGYQTRPLTVAYRNHYTWSVLMRGRISVTLIRHYLEQVELNGFEVKESMSALASPELVAQLKDKLSDFARTYEEGGVKEEEFEHYDAFVTCLEGFFKRYDDLLQMIRPYRSGEPIGE